MARRGLLRNSLLLLIGVMILFLGIWTRGHIVSMFLIIGGAFLLFYGILKIFDILLVKESAPLDVYIKEASKKETHVNETVQSEIEYIALSQMASGRNKGLGGRP